MGKLQLTLEEVAKHSTADDCWLVHEGLVYDVSPFTKRHPGGEKILVGKAGTDITVAMDAAHKHTRTARTLLRKYYIGQLNEWLNDEHLDATTGRPIRRGHSIQDGKEGDEQINLLSDWENDNLVDWNKPIFWQVGHLQPDKYWDWVHTPVDRHIRLFQSDMCEFFAGCPWWLIPLFWLPVSFLMAVRGYGQLLRGPVPLQLVGFNVTLTTAPIFWLLGVLSWQLFEYIIHRWLFHARPTGPFTVSMHFLFHGQHHKDPLNKSRLVFPPVPAMALAIPITFGLLWLLPAGISHVYLSGLAIGYIGYDMMHYYLHHGSPMLGYFKYVKRYHMRHHFESTDLGFGITSPLLDLPFGTVIPSEDCHLKND